MLRIPDVERKPLIPGETIPPVNLSPPGDSWPDRVSEAFALAVIGQIFRQERPRTDQAHLTAQHVEKLRQLIKTGVPEYSPKRRDAMRIELRLALAFAIHAHRPKFQQRKDPAIHAWATLTEQHRRSHGRTNADRHHDHERTRNHQAHRGRDEVYEAFHHHVHATMSPKILTDRPV